MQSWQIIELKVLRFSSDAMAGAQLQQWGGVRNSLPRNVPATNFSLIFAVLPPKISDSKPSRQTKRLAASYF